MKFPPLWISSAPPIPQEWHQDFQREWLLTVYARARMIAWFFLVYPIGIILLLIFIHFIKKFLVLLIVGVLLSSIFILSFLVLVSHADISSRKKQQRLRSIVRLYAGSFLFIIDCAFLIIWYKTGLNTSYLVGIFIYTFLFYSPSKIDSFFYILNFIFYLSCIYAFKHPLHNMLAAYISGTVSTFTAWLIANQLFDAKVKEFIDRRTIELQAEMLQQANERLNQLVCLDGLTQVANRYHFDRHLQQLWNLLSRSQKPLAILLCDVDHFKLYNDTYGHQAGDRCLQQVAMTIQEQVKRSGDLVARYGGEEFVVILTHTFGKDAIELAEKICKEVQQLNISHRCSPTEQVTISIGVSWVIPSITYSSEQLIAVADKALYQAKHQGRNQVFGWKVAD
ncbi:MAG TPA: diguanylate cyclase [Candidatus Obscuribacterales bacterium]